MIHRDVNNKMISSAELKNTAASENNNELLII